MKPVEVLLIEDNAGDTLLIGQILTECQLPVRLHVARDGEQALQMLADTNLKPSLIVLDLNIPKISGNAVLKRYKSRVVPVLVFSSSWDTDEIDEALALGATGIGAFYDEQVHRYLHLPPEEGQVVYHFAIGYPIPDPRLQASDGT